MDARLKSYCSPSDTPFQNNALWTPPGSPYINVLYLDVELAKPRVDTFQEVNEDALKNRTITYQRQRLEVSFWLSLRAHLIDFFSSVGLNDTVELEVLETAETYELTNVRFEDTSEEGDVVSAVKFTFDLVSITANGCTQSNYTLDSCPA